MLAHEPLTLSENAPRTPDMPNRCQFNMPGYQCSKPAEPGTDRCSTHQMNRGIDLVQENAKRVYIAAQWRAKVGAFADDPEIKRLNEEIGILRLLLTAKLNACKTDNDLLLHSSGIAELVTRVTKAVEACDRIDYRLGMLIDRQQLRAYGQSIIALVAAFIPDPDKLKEFADRLIQDIETVGGPGSERPLLNYHPNGRNGG